VRIQGSTPAPLLRLVVKPNDWEKTVKAKAQRDGATGRGQTYQAFWGRFLEELHSRQLPWTSSRKGRPQNWQALRSGITGVAFNCSFGRARLSSEVFFQDPDAAVNDARFAAARASRETIESTYGGPMSFEPSLGRDPGSQITGPATSDRPSNGTTTSSGYRDTEAAPHRDVPSSGYEWRILAMTSRAVALRKTPGAAVGTEPCASADRVRRRVVEPRRPG
jgi:Domain of unknown function (DUF4268)